MGKVHVELVDYNVLNMFSKAWLIANQEWKSDPLDL